MRRPSALVAVAGALAAAAWWPAAADAGEISLGDPVSHSNCPAFCTHGPNYRFSARPTADGTEDNSLRLVPGYGSGSLSYSNGEVAYRRFGGPDARTLTGPVEGYLARVAIGANLASRFAVFACYDDGSAPCSPSSEAPGSPATSASPFNRTFELPPRGAPQKPRLGLRFLGATGSYDFHGLVIDGRVRWYAIDNQSPTVTNVTPADGQLDVSPTAAVGADVGDARLRDAYLHLDGELVAAIEAAGSLAYVPTSGMSQGEHTATITATDTAGNPQTVVSWRFSVGGGGGGGATREVTGTECASGPRMAVTFAISGPSTNVRARETNGCWAWDRVVRRDSDERLAPTSCKYSNRRNLPAGGVPVWAYDDTNPSHSSVRDRRAMLRCYQLQSRIWSVERLPTRKRKGYVFMAYNFGRWAGRDHEAARVLKARFKQLYASSDGLDLETRAAYRAWRAAPRSAAPMLNIGSPLHRTTNAQVKAAVQRVCIVARARRQYRIGLYSGSGRGERVGATRRRMVLDALDACTQKHSLSR